MALSERVSRFQVHILIQPEHSSRVLIHLAIHPLIPTPEVEGVHLPALGCLIQGIMNGTPSRLVQLPKDDLWEISRLL
jgi:hypothetical protein